MDAGESLNDILRDPHLSGEDFAEIRAHQKHGTPIYGRSAVPEWHTYEARRKTAVKWVSMGMGLSFGYDLPEVLNLNTATKTDCFLRLQTETCRAAASPEPKTALVQNEATSIMVSFDSPCNSQLIEISDNRRFQATATH